MTSCYQISCEGVSLEQLQKALSLGLHNDLKVSLASSPQEARRMATKPSKGCPGVGGGDTAGVVAIAEVETLVLDWEASKGGGHFDKTSNRVEDSRSSGSGGRDMKLPPPDGGGEMDKTTPNPKAGSGGGGFVDAAVRLVEKRGDGFASTFTSAFGGGNRSATEQQKLKEQVSSLKKELNSAEERAKKEARRRDRRIHELEVVATESEASIAAFHQQQKALFDKFCLLRKKYDSIKAQLRDVLWDFIPAKALPGVEGMGPKWLEAIPPVDKSIVEEDDRVGDYDLLDTLGEGQFAAVRGIRKRKTPTGGSTGRSSSSSSSSSSVGGGSGSGSEVAAAGEKSARQTQRSTLFGGGGISSSSSGSRSSKQQQDDEQRRREQVQQAAAAAAAATAVDPPAELAVKMIHKSEVVSMTTLRRVDNEIAVLTRLRHDGIIRLCEVIHAPKCIYIITEKAGRDLFEFFDQHLEGVSEEVAAQILHKILRPVHYAHAHGVCHRDLKPENILFADKHRFTPQTRVVLCDFGLSARVESDAEEAECLRAGRPLRTHREFCGSPGFFAPEMLIKGAYNGKKADVWSLGCILLELVLGHEDYCRLWMGAYEYPKLSCTSSFEAAISKSIATLEVFLPTKLSPELCDFLLTSLALAPNKRLSVGRMLRHPWLEKYGLAFVGSEGVPPSPILSPEGVPTSVPSLSSSSSSSSSSSPLPPPPLQQQEELVVQHQPAAATVASAVGGDTAADRGGRGSKAGLSLTIDVPEYKYQEGSAAPGVETFFSAQSQSDLALGGGPAQEEEEEEEEEDAGPHGGNSTGATGAAVPSAGRGGVEEAAEHIARDLTERKGMDNGTQEEGEGRTPLGAVTVYCDDLDSTDDESSDGESGHAGGGGGAPTEEKKAGEEEEEAEEGVESELRASLAGASLDGDPTEGEEGPSGYPTEGKEEPSYPTEGEEDPSYPTEGREEGASPTRTGEKRFGFCGDRKEASSDGGQQQLVIQQQQQQQQQQEEEEEEEEEEEDEEEDPEQDQEQDQHGQRRQTDSALENVSFSRRAQSKLPVSFTAPPSQPDTPSVLKVRRDYIEPGNLLATKSWLDMKALADREEREMSNTSYSVSSTNSNSNWSCDDGTSDGASSGSTGQLTPGGSPTKVQVPVSPLLLPSLVRGSSAFSDGAFGGDTAVGDTAAATAAGRSSSGSIDEEEVEVEEEEEDECGFRVVAMRQQCEAALGEKESVESACTLAASPTRAAGCGSLTPRSTNNNVVGKRGEAGAPGGKKASSSRGGAALARGNKSSSGSGSGSYKGLMSLFEPSAPH